MFNLLRFRSTALPLLVGAYVSVSTWARADSNPAQPTETDRYSGFWTGPILAAPGRVTPAGHINAEPYFFATQAYGSYGEGWDFKRTAPKTALRPFLSLAVGLFDRLDAQLTLQAVHQRKQGRSDTHFADTGIRVGYQLFYETYGSWIPSVLFAIKETFPTGKYDAANPEQFSTDLTGGGAYTTTLILNGQKVLLMPNGHLMRLRLNLGYSIPSRVWVNGSNSFGGEAKTQGEVTPGNGFSATAAAEYHLTERWVLALDLAYSHSARDTFRGYRGFASDGSIPVIGNPVSHQFSVAPAIEYNFDGNVGIIVGIWASVAGKNDSAFVSPTIAVNFFY